MTMTRVFQAHGSPPLDILEYPQAAWRDRRSASDMARPSPQPGGEIAGDGGRPEAALAGDADRVAVSARARRLVRQAAPRPVQDSRQDAQFAQRLAWLERRGSRAAGSNGQAAASAKAAADQREGRMATASQDRSGRALLNRTGVEGRSGAGGLGQKAVALLRLDTPHAGVT